MKIRGKPFFMLFVAIMIMCAISLAAVASVPSLSNDQMWIDTGGGWTQSVSFPIDLRAERGSPGSFAVYIIRDLADPIGSPGGTFATLSEEKNMTQSGGNSTTALNNAGSNTLYNFYSMYAIATAHPAIVYLGDPQCFDFFMNVYCGKLRTKMTQHRLAGLGITALFLG